MKKITFSVLALSAVAISTPSMADSYVVSGPDPVQTYTVCSHSARYLVNDRAVRLRKGGKTLTISGNMATVSMDPSVFLQTSRLVRNSYQSLSADGNCYNP